ncbi:MAG: 50S ribosomal protein L18 [Candidatus Magasanikbacteria bacterium CG1_02_32_51]|uniref:Large ribosomal subunit protein uL18 n=1 Tax=Candidatus Magasanikbacteria bacterium CG1_02_32_51 TaxID=1805238 RepID=A0A1J4UAX0_9BACT|nr:MAG: 50S ribosomal protein L18 [Candidatus Magasanikbacteria bacterium CG1_02_32_51]
MKNTTSQQKRMRRHMRSRSRMQGSATIPRISVFRSLRGIYAQIIDDNNAKVLTSVNSKKDFDKTEDVGTRKGKVAIAFVLGKKLALKAKELNITTVVFDRSGYNYHGRVKALAEGARENGLKF